MSRSFHACGVLLGALGLVLLAIIASSPEDAQAPVRDTRGLWLYASSPAAAALPPSLTERDVEASEYPRTGPWHAGDGEISPYDWTHCCGLDRDTGEVYGCGLVAGGCGEHPADCHLPARTTAEELNHDPVTPADVDPWQQASLPGAIPADVLDGRSGYDLEYDTILYHEVRPLSAAAEETSFASIEQQLVEDLDRWMASGRQVWEAPAEATTLNDLFADEGLAILPAHPMATLLPPESEPSSIQRYTLIALSAACRGWAESLERLAREFSAAAAE